MMNNTKKNRLLKQLLTGGLLLAGALPGIFCVSNQMSGGVSEETNARFTGIICDSMGQGVPNVCVMLFQSTANPVINQGTTVTTNAGGNYSFDAAIAREYLLSAVDRISGHCLLTEKISMKQSLFRVDTLKKAGALKIILPDSTDTTRGYVYIRGSSLVRYLKNNVLPDNGKMVTILDSIPPVVIEGIYYSNSPDSTIQSIKITNNIQIISDDTITTVPLIFSKVFYNAINGNVSSMTCDPDDNLWFGCYDGALFYFNDTNWKDVTPFKVPHWTSDPICSFFIDQWKNIWITKYDDGIFKYDGNRWINYAYVLNDSVRYDAVAIAIDASNRLWISDPWVGAICYIPDTQQVQHTFYRKKVFTVQNSEIPSDMINSIFIDKSGEAIWFGTEKGIACFQNDTWKVFTAENSQIPGNSVRAIAQDSNDDIWIATSDGIACFNGTSWTPYTCDNSDLPEGSVSTIAVDMQDNIWCVIPSIGISFFNGRKWITYTAKNSNLPSDGAITGIAVLKNGEVWFCMKGGSVVCYKPDK